MRPWLRVVVMVYVRLTMANRGGAFLQYEMCCNMVITTGKQWKLLKEFSGTHDAMYDREGKQPNHFMFLTGNL
jgi:hypothetical protein